MLAQPCLTCTAVGEQDDLIRRIIGARLFDQRLRVVGPGLSGDDDLAAFGQQALLAVNHDDNNYVFRQTRFAVTTIVSILATAPGCVTASRWATAALISVS